jgi:hypothetical protein
MEKTSLASVLRLILAQIPSESGAVYVLRPYSVGLTVEITTAAAVRQELGIPENRPLLPLVWDALENMPISEALERVADFSGFSVVIDPRVADMTKAKADALLNNVPTDTAVRLLADMAGLGVVRLDNVFYVTSRENARALPVSDASQKHADGNASAKRR